MGIRRIDNSVGHFELRKQFFFDQRYTHILGIVNRSIDRSALTSWVWIKDLSGSIRVC